MNTSAGRSILTLILVISAILVTGCSDSKPSEATTDPEVIVDDEVVEGTDQGASVDGATGNGDANDNIDENNVPESEPTTVNPVPVVTDPVVADPAVPSAIQVEFSITVPAYQSDALQVRLTWGDVDFTASWVGDELWSASADFPVNTEHQLTITFYDDNGGIVLGSYKATYRTGNNAAEIYSVTADQFDTNQWDDDSDSISNLDELIAGTDPSVDEDALLEVRDFYILSQYSRMSVSYSFESRLSEERPFSETYDSNEVLAISGSVDIDGDGNGTLTYVVGEGYFALENLSGTRTSTGSSVIWEGSRWGYDGNDYTHTVEFTNTVSLIDQRTRQLIENLEGTNIGTYQFSWKTDTDLIGKLVEGTSLCEPVAGSISTMHRTNYDNSIALIPNVASARDVRTTTTINKKIDDPYWRVVVEESALIFSVIQLDPFQVVDVEPYVETATREYFARDLRMHRVPGSSVRPEEPEESFFICDFVDY